MSSIPSTPIAPYTHDPHSLHGCPFRYYPAHTTSPAPLIYSAPSLDASIIGAAPDLILLESFTVTNGFYQLVSPQGFILANSPDFLLAMDFTSAWRIPVVVGSPNFIHYPLYIPTSTATPSAITRWALLLELIVSAFLFQSAPVLITTLMAWVDRTPHVFINALSNALDHFSAYFSHLGSAFVMTAEMLFHKISTLSPGYSYIFRFISLDDYERTPTPSASSSATAAQYLPLATAMSRGGPFSSVQSRDFPLASRRALLQELARRSASLLLVSAPSLVTTKPLSPGFLSSFTANNALYTSPLLHC